MHAAAVIRHDIQHVAHVPLAESLAQGDQRLAAAQNRIYFTEVADIVTMAGEGGENGIKVEGVDPKLLKIIEVSFDPCQVASIKRHQTVVFVCRFAPGKSFAGISVARVGFFYRIVAGITVGKTIRKNLVKNGLLQPGNWLKARQELEVEDCQRRVQAYPERVQPPDPAFGLNGKAIVQARLIDLEGSLPNAVTSLRGLRHHGGELLFPVGNGAQNNLVGFNLAGNQQAHRDRFSQGRIGIGEVIGSGRVQYMCEPGGLEWINSFHKG